ncbi:MAG: helix-turn-helix domain-containing protein [Planctomycetes bacterium]|nr:helix-turn-helix domain-containing protein [Planctomycetota bacterium]
MHHPVAKKEEGYITDRSPGPPPGLLMAGHLTRCYRREVLRPEGTRDWLLVLVLGGRAFYKQPGVYFEVAAGDVVLAEPNSYMHYAPIFPGAWDCLWVHFNPRPEWLDALKLPRAGKGLFKYRFESAKKRRPISDALRRCVAYSQSSDLLHAQELAFSSLEEALYLVARERKQDARHPALSEPVRRVVDHLSGDLAARHTLASLGRVARLSATRLTHRFKAETGESVIAYLLKLRLRRGAVLLQASEKSVKEIAYATGFASPFYFSRQFRRHFRMSPVAYRSRVASRKAAK